MQPPQVKPPRGVTVGIAVELLGIAFAVATFRREEILTKWK
ncbi:MAG TPA: hypothetical protein VEY12_10100 [Thermoplasmata archaeon]|nr:hypothetical protein [Thermoplasmata archaeon]